MLHLETVGGQIALNANFYKYCFKVCSQAHLQMLLHMQKTNIHKIESRIKPFLAPAPCNPINCLHDYTQCLVAL